MSSLLGDFTSWIDSKKRIASDNLGSLLADPYSTIQRLGTQGADQLAASADMFASGDYGQMGSSLLGNGMASPLTVIKFPGPKVPTYGVDELPMTGSLLGKFQDVPNLDKLREMKSASFEKWQSGSGDVSDFWKTLYPTKFKTDDIVEYGGKLGKILESGNTPWVRFFDGSEGPIAQGLLRKPSLREIK